MPGTEKQTSRKELERLIHYWPGYTFKPSLPYDKGVTIYDRNKNEVEEFTSNDQCYLTMMEALTTKNGWYPGREETPLYGKLPENPVCTQEARRSATFKMARKALDLRIHSDILFTILGINPLNTDWEKKTKKILQIRRKKKQK